MSKKKSLKPLGHPFAMRAICLAIIGSHSALALAGPGFGASADVNLNPILLPTFYAGSPSGARAWVDQSGNPAPSAGMPADYDPALFTQFRQKVDALYPNGYPGTGKAIRKWVDQLPRPAKYSGTTVTNPATFKDGTQTWIPVAVQTKWTPPNTVTTANPNGTVSTDDYLEIGAIEYSHRLHSDLKKATTLRGYIQIDHQASNGRTAIAGSKALRLYYPNSSGKVAFASNETPPSDAVAIMINATNIDGSLKGSLVQARAFDLPHPLGPIINGTKDVPMRVKFLNLLPIGRAQVATPAVVSNGVITQQAVISKRNGDLFLPIDRSLTGAGYGPDGKHVYTQNRVNIHLHGGDTPWISDGTPWQWITPMGEADASRSDVQSIASWVNDAKNPLDPSLLPSFLRGASAVNVPDMADPGPGAMTYYFPNGQSARMLWYHDHSIGTTRLHVHAGMVSVFNLTDPTEQNLITRGVLPTADYTIPLVLEDKSFVPDDISLQDARWNTTAWGAPGDMWWPHVYETVQDPKQDTGFNAVGRWHYGPWFWPVFPAAYPMPSGAYGDETTVPEAWNDSMLVNGVVYPELVVEPRTYRFKILNAANARMFTFNLFVADPTTLRDDGEANVEPMMIPVPSITTPACAPGETRSTQVNGEWCMPETWPTEVSTRPMGVPDFKAQGPTVYQIANEGGWLPGVAAKDPQPLNFLLDKGRAAVLNVEYTNTGLHLGNGERADVVIDFSQYAGKTLIVYSDPPAAQPAGDPRNEYGPGVGDQSSTGGSEDTKPGYGPNSHTLMRIKVMATAPAAAMNPVTLDTEIKAAYKASQPLPIVAQSAYNAALGTNWDDSQAFANIYAGSLKQPTFKFVPGAPATFNSVKVTNQGNGYTRVPKVTVSAPTATGSVQATAAASLKINQLHIIEPGSGYKVAPLVSITNVNSGTGSGAAATVRLGVAGVNVVNGGAGYTTGSVTGVTVTNGGQYQKTATLNTITLGNATANRYPTGTPTVTITGGGGSGAVATATMTGTGTSRRISAITVTNKGSGYTSAPTVTISAPSGSGGVQATATATINALAYSTPTVTFNTPTGGTAAAGTVVFNTTTGQVTGVTVTSAGRGYTTAPVVTFSTAGQTAAPTVTVTSTQAPNITFSAPIEAGGRTATGVAVLSTAGAVTGVTVTDPGTGYVVVPTVTVTGTSTRAASLTAHGKVTSLTLDIPDPANADSAGGGGYSDLSTVESEPNNVNPGLAIIFTDPPAGGVRATAGATGKVFDITLTKNGQGYTSAPTVTLARNSAEPAYSANGNALGNYTVISTTMAPQIAATAQADTANGGSAQGSILVKTKAIQELFDSTYGRLNATLGVEVPYTSALTQTTVPLGYIDVPTEEFQDGETQIWKITHNGVDTHPMHFHLLNVQLLNRVGWDNFITPPLANELGWKETIKMSPLEDTIIALRAKKPSLPGFGLPNSVRALDPSQPLNALTGFTQIDPKNGLAATMYNQMQDFGWEYVWHCHILGHEENDFMRPIIFRANEAIPTAATGLTATQAGGSTAVQLAWTDTASTEYQYRVERQAQGSTAWSTIGTALANAKVYTDSTAGANATYKYRVVAVGAAGEAASSSASSAALVPAVPTSVSAASRRTTTGGIQLSWSAPTVSSAAGAATYYEVQMCSTTVGITGLCTGSWTTVTTGTSLTALTFTQKTTTAGAALTTGARYGFRVRAGNASGPGPWNNTTTSTFTTY